MQVYVRARGHNNGEGNKAQQNQTDENGENSSASLTHILESHKTCWPTLLND